MKRLREADVITWAVLFTIAWLALVVVDPDNGVHDPALLDLPGIRAPVQNSIKTASSTTSPIER